MALKKNLERPTDLTVTDAYWKIVETRETFYGTQWQAKPLFAAYLDKASGDANGSRLKTFEPGTLTLDKLLAGGARKECYDQVKAAALADATHELNGTTDAQDP